MEMMNRKKLHIRKNFSNRFLNAIVGLQKHCLF